MATTAATAAGNSNNSHNSCSWQRQQHGENDAMGRVGWNIVMERWATTRQGGGEEHDVEVTPPRRIVFSTQHNERTKDHHLLLHCRKRAAYARFRQWRLCTNISTTTTTMYTTSNALK
jgi:hypothetical protein